MKLIVVLLVLSVCAMGYGYWDIFDKGGRVTGVSPVSAALAGSSAPLGNSPLQLFTNPSALAGAEKTSLAMGGWGTGWREEIHYETLCTEPYRYNLGGMSPRGSFAFSTPLGNGLTAAAGIATVAQYEMKGTMLVYLEDGSGHPSLWKTMVADGTGDLHEAMASVAGAAGPVRLGLSAGYRFGSGNSTVYSNRASGSAFDSTYYNSWDSESFAVRAGASMDAGFNRVYATFSSGDNRYSSYAGAGNLAFFPFLKGGFLGAEVGVVDGDELFMNACTSYPWAIDRMNVFLGISGYRPDGASKTGMGISYGMSYSFGPHRVTGAYQWNSRYRNGTAIETDYITWIYDSGESYVAGYELTF